MILSGEQPDYINAVTANVSHHNPYMSHYCKHCVPCMQGYKQQKAYIIAQNPLKSTVRNFWKLITDRKCGAVVSLSQLAENGEVRMLPELHL